ncbi:DNA primase [Lederbergia graminis]|uniref:DNA primase n=1 Tax=Lederbergia graminis TaxID=735518 RepID=A0ABW0LL64_9BACI|nr:DNA primase [Paenibacillus bovis]HLU23843.1 DNA primase [Bacillaceae bacterium]
MSTRIPEDKLNELRQSTDIVDVISDYVQLKKQGRNYFGLCPFHGENTPSFSVSAEKQIFHCFGCGMGGNVFTFLMEIESISFQDAALKIAEKGNVQLEIEGSQNRHKENELPPEHADMMEAHELIAKFYNHLLMNTNEGSIALEYLLNRGFTEESIQKFQIGYSLPSWDFSLKFLEKRGFHTELLEKAGLVAVRDKDNSHFDRFRDRIMFPLLNSQGRIVGFSARSLTKENQPKYLNTPETEIFNKSSLLYNYYNARSKIRKQGYAILFEGFADVISADSAGVHNGVAVMGTSLTEQHIHLLKRLTDSILLCFDSDSAGAEAAYRSGTMLVKKGLTVTVAMLPSKMDPDDYIMKFGAEKFREDVIGNPQTWMAYKLIYFRNGKNLQNEGDKLEYINQAMKEIGELDNPVERDIYLRQLSEEFSLSLTALSEQLQQIRETIPKQKPKEKELVIQPEPSVTKSIPTAYEIAERNLLARMLHDEEITYKVVEMLGDTPFQYDEHQAILTYLVGYYEAGNIPDLSLFINYLPDKKLRTIVTEIEMHDLNHDYNEKEIRDYVSHVLKHAKLLMIKKKQAEQKAAEKNNDFTSAMQILQEIIELRRSL